LEVKEISNSYRLLVILFGFLALSSCFYGNFVLAQTDQTVTKLQAANYAVDHAYENVIRAEEAGANITDLQGRLNFAAIYLAQAENDYRAGDYNGASVKADSVLPIAQEVTEAAQNAKQNALVSHRNTLWLTIAFTAIGASVFVLVLFLVWRKLKNIYMAKYFGSKPEVVESAG
jgi:hypothetical protein